MRHCHTGRICLARQPECNEDCHFDNAGLEVRKIKAYPAVPADIQPVPEQWHTVGKIMIGAVLAMITVFFSLMFFTGLYIWGLIL
jgi:hypothetical protein